MDDMQDLLIRFQFYLRDKKLITDYDWDYEHEARKFLRQRKLLSILSNLQSKWLETAKKRRK